MAAKSKSAAGEKTITKNRRALHDYAIEERLEAGISLVGSEVKSCREGRANLNDAYVQVMRGEAVLINSSIDEYGPANRFNHQPTRARKLLLHRREIDKLEIQLRQRGQTAVALSMYFKDGLVKVELGIGKGRSHADRREAVREREMKREVDRAMRRR